MGNNSDALKYVLARYTILIKLLAHKPPNRTLNPQKISGWFSKLGSLFGSLI